MLRRQRLAPATAPYLGRTSRGIRQMTKALRIVVHILVFLAAIVVFYIGLFVGLQVNSNMGTLLWLAAFVIAGVNLFWIMRSRVRRA